MSIGLRVYLRPLSGRHVRAVQALASDEAIARWTAIPHPYPRDGAQTFVEREQRLRARGLHATFAVCDADGLLGVVGLRRDPMMPEGAELGYWIGRPYWGRGHATAAVTQILAHGFGRMRLAVVFARCFSANRASARVLERLAFRFAGLDASQDPRRPHEPMRRYELTREEWRRRPVGG